MDYISQVNLDVSCLLHKLFQHCDAPKNNSIDKLFQSELDWFTKNNYNTEN